ncbi:hypothetical protein [Flavobacterium sp. SM2513]|uniref:hypothetical protein n=1 Tax=Flavobacterium sp. SM2513 TaxID=3424766 RepID=UPI003D7FDF11
MKKVDLFYGMLIGILAASLGIYLFVALFTEYEFIEGYSILKRQGQLGKLIALGSILNLFAFFFLLKINKELMARGVVLATLLLTVVTLFA